MYEQIPTPEILQSSRQWEKKSKGGRNETTKWWSKQLSLWSKAVLFRWQVSVSSPAASFRPYCLILFVLLFNPLPQKATWKFTTTTCTDGQQWDFASSHPLVVKSSIKCSGLSQTLMTTQDLSLRKPEKTISLLPFQGEEIPLYPVKLVPLLHIYEWDLFMIVGQVYGKEETCAQSSLSPCQPPRTAASYLYDSCTSAPAYLLAKHSTKLGYSKEMRPFYHLPRQSSECLHRISSTFGFQVLAVHRKKLSKSKPIYFSFQHNCLWNDYRVQEP